jgi:hypothetical protein
MASCGGVNAKEGAGSSGRGEVAPASLTFSPLRFPILGVMEKCDYRQHFCLSINAIESYKWRMWNNNLIDVPTRAIGSDARIGGEDIENKSTRALEAALRD